MNASLKFSVVALLASTRWAVGAFEQETVAVWTFSGSGYKGYLDGEAYQAKFDGSRDLTAGRRGELYVADTHNHRIRKVETDGTVSTFAGSGELGYRDGRREEAQFNHPYSIVMDSKENLIVADIYNHAIRKITPDGFVTTLAGGRGQGWLDGDGIFAQFDEPRGIAIDKNDTTYCFDLGTHLLRKIYSNGTVVTLAGSEAGYADGQGSAAKFHGIGGLAVDENGTMYAADESNHVIRKIEPDGTVSTFAGTGENASVNGDASIAAFNHPRDVELDTDGNLIVTTKHLIRLVTMDGQVSTIAGTGDMGYVDGPGDVAEFSSPRGIAVNSENTIFVIDLNLVIRGITDQKTRIFSATSPRFDTSWEVLILGALSFLVMFQM